MTPWANGMQIGPYLLAGPIGSGGMGEVWKARDTRLDRIVAIKRLKGQHTARFEQEARAIAALNHSNICQIYDVGPDYLVMEYIEGRSPEGPLPAEAALKLAAQIADALTEAHSRGILHRNRQADGGCRRDADHGGFGDGHTCVYVAGAGRGQGAGRAVGRCYMRFQTAAVPSTVWAQCSAMSLSR